MAPVILIIEDNEMNMKLLKSIINKAQCQVIEATDAESGILLTKIHKPDLILMDIQLPDMDGLQATRIIKKDPDLNHIPIVALTSHAMIGDDNKAKAAGCDGYITKPINTRTFMNEIFYFIKSKDEQDIEPKKQEIDYKPRILVVDDEPNNVKLISAMLFKEHFDIITAYDGKAALDIVNSRKIDLILMDIMMPEIDGYQVTQLVKQNPQTKDIPIILVTALQSEHDKKLGFDAGADEFLTKPINKIEIIARIRSMLRLKQYREQMVVRIQSEGQKNISSLNEKSFRNKNVQSVLLVEDNDKDSKLIQRLIINEPYQLMRVKSGEEAISLAMNEKIDLILLDIILPGLDGYQVCQYLKNNDRTRDIQIVMITGLSDLESRLKGVEEGVDDFLVKPIDNRELKSRINALLRKKAYHDLLQSHREQALSLAVTDGLTQLYNQSYFKRYLDIEIARAQCHQYNVGLLIADLDDFKKYNDELGHLFGDEILRFFARLIRSHIQEIDFPVRYGGEEFAIVFPYAEVEKVIAVAERIRKSVEQYVFPEVENPLLARITVSIGIAFCPIDAIKSNELIEKADHRLYQAKKSGKNRIFIN